MGMSEAVCLPVDSPEPAEVAPSPTGSTRSPAAGCAGTTLCARR